MKKVFLSASDLGLDGVTTAAQQISKIFDIDAFERFAVFVNFTDGGGNTSKVACQIEYSPDHYQDAGAVFTTDQTTSTAGGTVTLAPMTLEQTIAVTGGDDSEGWNWEVTSACARACRLTFTFTDGNASDSITVRVVGANYN